MKTSRLLIVAAALVLAPAASAAYPTPFAVQNGTGLLSLDHSLRFVALNAGRNTTVSALRVRGSAGVMTRKIPGAFGVPQITQNGLAGGLFHDGSAFVLQNIGIKPTSRFVVVDTRDLGVRRTVTLKGTFGFDALSPDGSKLFLIQHMTTDDLSHYVVRAYDLRANALLPGRIADKAQKSWVMQGFATSRATSADGRWVYTLYANPGGYPFVHALDAVRGVAHCVGLPWKALEQTAIFNARLVIRGGKLDVRLADGSTWRSIDRRTWRLSHS
jgi:hypothetical protein